MNPAQPRLLCIPVSGAFGMGEYARSLAIARAFSARWPAARVHFALSRAAPYAAGAPFQSTLLPSSPTFHTPAVVALIEEFRPTIVLFDNAGRTAQLRAARRVGAKVIYISARRRQRRRAFRWRWMRLLDEHWIAYPAFLAGAPSLAERVKLRLLGRPRLRYLDVILPAANRQSQDGLLRRLGLVRGRYVLVVPGGGTGHPRALDAVARFRDAATALAAAGTPVIFIGADAAGGAGSVARGAGSAAGGAGSAAGGGTAPADGAAAAVSPLHAVGSLPQPDLMELMRAARLVIANGGSTLLQSIACGTATVAVPIADDQVERIRGCVAAGVCLTAALDAGDIARNAKLLLADEPARAALAARASRLGLADGISVALAALADG